MALFYADENFSQPVVEILRTLGHDVLTIVEDGKANQRIPDDEVLRIASHHKRCILTFNRKHFIQLHNSNVEHQGIMVCTIDPDAEALAKRIHNAVAEYESLEGQLIRIVRPNP